MIILLEHMLPCTSHASISPSRMHPCRHLAGIHSDPIRVRVRVRVRVRAYPMHPSRPALLSKAACPSASPQPGTQHHVVGTWGY